MRAMRSERVLEVEERAVGRIVLIRQTHPGLRQMRQLEVDLRCAKLDTNVSGCASGGRMVREIVQIGERRRRRHLDSGRPICRQYVSMNGV